MMLRFPYHWATVGISWPTFLGSTASGHRRYAQGSRNNETSEVLM